MANTSKLADLRNSTAPAPVFSDPKEPKPVPKAKVKAKVKAATMAQLNACFAGARQEREARKALIDLVRTVHKQGRDLAEMQKRFLMGRTLDLVPAIRKLRLNSYDAETLNWETVTPLWEAEKGKKNPDATTAKPSEKRDPDFHRGFRAAETAWSSIRSQAGVMAEAEGEGKRSTEGKGRPQGKGAGKRKDGDKPKLEADKPKVVVTAAWTSKMDAAVGIAEGMAALMIRAEANKAIVPATMLDTLSRAAREIQAQLLKLRETSAKVAEATAPTPKPKVIRKPKAETPKA